MFEIVNVYRGYFCLIKKNPLNFSYDFFIKITTFFNSLLFTMLGDWCLLKVLGPEEKRRNVTKSLYHRGSNHTV
jgi:hypothetical protein